MNYSVNVKSAPNIHQLPSSLPDGPTIISPPGDVEAEYHDNVTLSCIAEGLPPPNITWFVQPSGGSPSELMEDTNIAIEIETVDDGASSTLTLYNVQPSDTANYTCSIVNCLGETEDTAVVTVLGAYVIQAHTTPTSMHC